MALRFRNDYIRKTRPAAFREDVTGSFPPIPYPIASQAITHPAKVDPGVGNGTNGLICDNIYARQSETDFLSMSFSSGLYTGIMECLHLASGTNVLDNPKASEIYGKVAYAFYDFGICCNRNIVATGRETDACRGLDNAIKEFVLNLPECK